MHEVLFVTYAIGVAYMRVRTRFLQRRLSLLLHTCPLQRGLDGSDALQHRILRISCVLPEDVAQGLESAHHVGVLDATGPRPSRRWRSQRE